MIRGAIFDMDGTLLDSMAVWDQLSQRYLSKFGVQVTPHDYAMLEAKTQLEGAQYFCSAYPQITETPEQIMQGLDRLITERYAQLARPRVGVYDFLERLHRNGVKMAVATLTGRRHAEKALRERDMLDYFAFLMTIEDVGVSKREPDIYLAAAQRLGLPPCDCMVFEDAPYAGETAKRAGFQVCGVAEPWYAADEAQLRAASDLFICRSYDELAGRL